MNFNLQPKNEQAPAAEAPSHPQPSSGGMDYFADQPLLRETESYLGLSNMRSFNGYFPNPSDSCTVIQMKIENERIREEKILTEMARRRMFDEELRREMMLDRHLTLNGSDSFFSSPSMLSSNHRSSSYLHQSETRSLEGLRSLEEMLAFSFQKRSEFMKVDRLESSKSMQFQGGPEPRVSTVKLPPFEGDKENPKLMENPNPIGNLSGWKRKAESSLSMGVDEPTPATSSKKTPLSIGVDEPTSLKKTPLSIGDDKPTPATSSKKSVSNMRNYCSLCNVSATSTKNLRQHLHGKKHWLNELELKQKEGENFEIGFFPKTAVDKKRS